MVGRWSTEQVVALAPDAASAKAGRALAVPSRWTETGCSADPAALWGLCQGSGKNPYRAVVDLAGPAYRCSCPSRKFPCKHALGLLLTWAENGVADTAADAVPAWADEWLGRRVAKAAAGPVGPPADAAAARRRAEQRADRVAAGLDELDRWLRDQVRTGLAGTDQAAHRHFDTIAARMVDAQAPGVAGTLRDLAGPASSGEGWVERLVEEYGLLRLLVHSHRRADELPAPLAATVRARVGYPVGREDALAGEALRDRWTVLGRYDEATTRLTARRIWLAGEASGRFGLALSYAAPGQALDASLVPGTVLDATVRYFPGSPPLRLLVEERHGEPEPVPAAGPATTTGVAAALASYAEALAGDPWLALWPMVLAGVTPVMPSGGEGWRLVDAAGGTLPLRARAAGQWTLLAVSGGNPVTVAGEWTPDGLRVLSAYTDEGMAAL